MTKYDINLSNGSILAELYSMETNGPNNLSTPRQIKTARPKFGITGTTSTIITIDGDFTSIFQPNFQFNIIGTGGNDGTYTVSSSTFDTSKTNITITGTFPNSGPGGDIVAHVFQLFGDLSYRFIPSFIFNVNNSNNNGIDGPYTVTTEGSYYDGNITTIPVTNNSILGDDTANLPPSYGDTSYTIYDANTTLKLPGTGVIDYGENIIENLVHITENWAADVAPHLNTNIGDSPAGNSLKGQLWYKTLAGEEGFQFYDGTSWSNHQDIDDGALIFRDVEDSNKDIYITASETNLPSPWAGSNEPGLVVWNQTDPSALDPIFRVLSLNGTERLRVEHDGWIRTDDNLEVRGGGNGSNQSYFYGMVGIGQDGLPTITQTLTVEGNGIAVNSDTGNEAALHLNSSNSSGSIIYFKLNDVIESSISIFQRNGIVWSVPHQTTDNSINMYVAGGNTVDGTNASSVIVIAGDNTNGNDAGDVNISAGKNVTGLNAGTVSITAGSNDTGANAGAININAGYNTNGANGGNVSIEAGANDYGTKAGNINIKAGVSTHTANGGNVTISGGFASDATASAGDATITGGNGNNGAVAGNLILAAGNGSSSAGGEISIRGGNSESDIGGDVVILSGDTNDNVKLSGEIHIVSGAAWYGGGSGNVAIATGFVFDQFSSNTTGTETSGDLSIYTGAVYKTYGNSGNINITSGDIYGYSKNNSGNVSILTGNGSKVGGVGSINIIPGTADLLSNFDGGTVDITGGVSGGTAVTAGDVNISGGTGAGTATGGNVNITGGIGAGGATNGIVDITGDANISGYLGINTATPTGTLHLAVGGNIRVDGQLYGSSLTAVTPTYSFTTDTNTGMFNSGADALGFATNGTEQLTINNIGQLHALNHLAAHPAYSFVNATDTGMYVTIGGSSVLMLATGGVDAISMSDTAVNILHPIDVTGTATVSDQILGYNSLVANAPTYAFTADSTTGISNIASGIISFVNLGVQRFKFEGDGTLSSTTASYETLLTEDNDIPNKKYVDDEILSAVTSQDQLGELIDVTITSPVDDEVLTYQSGSPNGWINKTLPALDTAVWGNISGVILSQTDLQLELDNKEDDLGDPSIDGQVLSSTVVGVRSWITQSVSYFIDIEGTTGSPAMIENSLPSGWTTTYNGVGDYTITHNLGDAEIGTAIQAMYNVSGRIVNIVSLTSNDIRFQIVDYTNVAIEGNLVGKIIR